MAYWLMKTEPEEFSWDDQVTRGAKGEPWTGVRNYRARSNLKKMKKGEHYELHRDRLFGSVGWGRKAETVIGIQSAEKDPLPLHRLAALKYPLGNRVATGPPILQE